MLWLVSKFFSEKNENSYFGNLSDFKISEKYLARISKWLPRCWWWMLETKCVGDNFVILVTGLANMSPIVPILLHERLALTLQKMSLISKFRHQHPKTVTNIYVAFWTSSWDKLWKQPFNSEFYVGTHRRRSTINCNLSCNNFCLIINFDKGLTNRLQRWYDCIVLWLISENRTCPYCPGPPCPDRLRGTRVLTLRLVLLDLLSLICLLWDIFHLLLIRDPRTASGHQDLLKPQDRKKI